MARQRGNSPPASGSPGGNRKSRVANHYEIGQLAKDYGARHDRIHKTFKQRFATKEAFAAWEEACRAFHNSNSPMRELVSPGGRARLRQGDPATVERAITFLEVDPYVFRSGYAKVTVIRCIKSLEHTAGQLARLQAVVLKVLDHCDRHPFHAYCRLAAAVDEPELEGRIRERLDSTEHRVGCRARRLLDYLAQWRRTNAGKRVAPGSADPASEA